MRGIAVVSNKMTGLSLAALMLLAAGFSTPSQAGDTFDRLWRNPLVKQAAIGAAAGGVAGAVTDRTTVGKGAVIGGLTGAGSGALDKVDALDNRPLVKSTLRGAIIGTGASTIMDSSKVKGAAVGAGVGAGAHYIRDYLRD